MRRTLRLAVACAAATSAACLGLVGPASASEPPAYTLDFPAGLACDFDLHVEAFGETKDLKDLPARHSAVRTLFAGRGFDLVFTNQATGTTYSLRGDGSVNQTAIFADGTQEIELAGHNVVILFPTDNPAGPSTVQYVGRVVITVDANGVWTLTQVSGHAVDICSALSG